MRESHLVIHVVNGKDGECFPGSESEKFLFFVVVKEATDELIILKNLGRDSA